MITTAIVFDHRGRTKKGKEGPLEVRVTIDRKPYYINTGIRVCARQWQFDKVVNHPQADNLNERLSILLDRIMQDINFSLKHNCEIDVAKIRRHAWGSSMSDSFIQWLHEEVKLLRVKDGTMKHYNSFVKKIQEYGKMQDWSDITPENVYKWDAWLRELPGRDSEKISVGGVYNYHKCMRALLKRAERTGLLAVNPYHRLTGEFQKGDKENTEYLTEDEMQKIMDFSPTPGSWLERAKDLFVFQMWTGLSYSDAQAFDISAYKEVNGKWMIVGSRIKTGQPFVNQLLPPAVEVLKKYGMSVPKLSNQAYNRELKVVGAAIGLNIKLHTHLARHTFATYMLRNGVKFENVSKMLGHASIKQTQRYAKVLAESVHEDFDMIEEKLKKASPEV